VSTAGDEQVSWFDVAMNNALAVRGVQAIGNFNSPGQQAFGFDRMCRDALSQGHAFQVLHGDEAPALMFSDFVDGADVGMVQGRCRPRLSPESLQDLRIARYQVWQKFQRDEAAKLCVLCFVHHAHSTAPQFLQDAVVRDGFADHLE